MRRKKDEINSTSPHLHRHMKGPNVRTKNKKGKKSGQEMRRKVCQFELHTSYKTAGDWTVGRGLGRDHPIGQGQGRDLRGRT